MPDMTELYGDLENFHKHYKVDPINKCRIWTLATFRLRTGLNTHNPRRLAVQLTGRVIPVRKNLMVICGNETCVNPEHIRMKGSGAPVEDNNTLYLEEFNQFSDSDYNIANRYAVSVAEAGKARRRTIKLIYDVMASKIDNPGKLAQKFNIPVSYVKDILRVTPEEFNDYQYDPTSEIDDPNVINPRALKFKIKIAL